MWDPPRESQREETKGEDPVKTQNLKMISIQNNSNNKTTFIEYLLQAK